MQTLFGLIHRSITFLAVAAVLYFAAGCTRTNANDNRSELNGTSSAKMEEPSPTVNLRSEMPPDPRAAIPTPTIAASPTAPPRVDKRAFQKAPALSSTTWINSAPLSIKALAGKVVVIEFWTFACYNCQNTLPYVKRWDQRYRAQGLVTIGVHTPELSFERDLANVRQAVKEDGIEYPIAVDPDYSNWNRYRVQAWPTWFIVDKEGYIRYSHIGEGDYDRSESTIRMLLAEGD